MSLTFVARAVFDFFVAIVNFAVFALVDVVTVAIVSAITITNVRHRQRVIVALHSARRQQVQQLPAPAQPLRIPEGGEGP